MSVQTALTPTPTREGQPARPTAERQAALAAALPGGTPTSPPSQTLTCGPSQLHAMGETTGLLTCGMYKGSPLRPQLNRSEVFSDVARLPKTNPRPVSRQPQVRPFSPLSQPPGLQCGGAGPSGTCFPPNGCVTV